MNHLKVLQQKEGRTVLTNMHVKNKVNSLPIKVNNNLEISNLHNNNAETYGYCSRMLVMSVMGIVLVTMVAAVLVVARSTTFQEETRAAASYSVRLGAATAALAAASGPAARVLSCYYNPPGARHAAARATPLLPTDINPHLCTHINVGFAPIRNKQIFIEKDLNQTLIEIIKLKKINSDLKILLSIGGSGNDSGFPDMVVNHASRKIFIKSIKSVLRNYSLDGIDLDWEFPAFDESGPYKSRERQHFSQLLREIRMEYIREKRAYLLTVAVAAPQTIVDVSYDIDQLNLYTDFVNIMTYDFHSFTKYTPFTGLNSPLYVRPEEQLYMATLNINYTVHMYLDKGLDRNKIVVGIPTYGHTFTLVNADNTAIGSPAKAFGTLGSLGFVNYPDICTFLKTYGSEVTVVMENSTKVPYLYRQLEWVSFDTPQSVADKAKFIMDYGLRGGMIYSLNSDDYEGVCNKEYRDKVQFPLSVSARNILIEESTQQT